MVQDRRVLEWNMGTGLEELRNDDYLSWNILFFSLFLYSQPLSAVRLSSCTLQFFVDDDVTTTCLSFPWRRCCGLDYQYVISS